MNTTGNSPMLAWSSNCDNQAKRIQDFRAKIGYIKRRIAEMNAELDQTNGVSHKPGFWVEYMDLHHMAWKKRDEEWPQLNSWKVWEERDVGDGESNKYNRLTALMYDVSQEVSHLPREMKY